jgi:hypothetical protein
MYWIYIILFLGPLGATIYLLIVAFPDLIAFNPSFQGYSRRRRIAELEAITRQNPSAGNYEELGDRLMEEGNLEGARRAFDGAIATRTPSLDAYYRRGLCALRAGDAAAAIPDLKRVVDTEPDYDFHRAAGLLAQAHAKAGDTQKAEALFLRAAATSTLAETYLNYAEMLASAGRKAEAREWAQKVLDKELTMPHYLRRRERRWFRSAGEMLKRLAAQE